MAMYSGVLSGEGYDRGMARGWVVFEKKSEGVK